MTAPKPTEIKREGESALRVSWSDGSQSTLSSEILRRNCPCAGCKEQRGDTSHAQPLTPKKSSLLKVVSSSSQEELALKGVWAIGNYAVGISWGDGHDTGIYTYELLRSLG